MRPIFNTEMIIYPSKVNLDEKILFGSIPHFTDPEILPSIDIRVQHLKLAMHESMPNNHRPEWNAEFSIPIQTLYRHLRNCWVLKMSDFTKQNFLILVSL